MEPDRRGKNWWPIFERDFAFQIPISAPDRSRSTIRGIGMGQNAAGATSTARTTQALRGRAQVDHASTAFFVDRAQAGGAPRPPTGCFLKFNGTAGILGAYGESKKITGREGWNHRDTHHRDLDLSSRHTDRLAVLFLFFLRQVVTPGEISGPGSTTSSKSQQLPLGDQRGASQTRAHAAMEHLAAPPFGRLAARSRAFFNLLTMRQLPDNGGSGPS